MQDIDGETTAYIIIEVLIAFLSISGNGLVCYVVMNNRSMRKKPMYMFLTSLALADIFVGAVAIPFAILTKLGLPHNAPYLCIAMLTFIIIPTQISIFNLMTVSIERYIAIRYPRVHFSKLTQRPALYLIICTWIVSVLLGFIPMGWNNIKSAIPANQNDNTSKTNTSFSSNPQVECQFVEVMSDNYMLFNFFACTLSPLLVCAALYCLLFRSLLRTYRGPWNSMFMSSTRSDYQHTSSFKNSTPPMESGSTRSNHEATNEAKQHEKFRMEQSHDSEFSNTALKTNQDSDAQNGKCWNGLSELQVRKFCVKMNVKSQRKSQQRDSKRDSIIIEEISSEVGFELQKPSDHQKRPSDIRAFKPKENHAKKLKRKKEIHAAGVLALIVLMFAICWLPIHIINTIQRFSDGNVQIPIWLTSVAILLSHANSAVNFFLYSWRLRAFRKELNRRVFLKITALCRCS